MRSVQDSGPRLLGWSRRVLWPSAAAVFNHGPVIVSGWLRSESVCAALKTEVSAWVWVGGILGNPESVGAGTVGGDVLLSVVAVQFGWVSCRPDFLDRLEGVLEVCLFVASKRRRADGNAATRS